MPPICPSNRNDRSTTACASPSKSRVWQPRDAELVRKNRGFAGRPAVWLWGAPRPGALRAPDYGARLRLAGPPYQVLRLGDFSDGLVMLVWKMRLDEAHPAI